jgi:superfamily I DNA and RNA helicase
VHIFKYEFKSEVTVKMEGSNLLRNATNVLPNDVSHVTKDLNFHQEICKYLRIYIFFVAFHHKVQNYKDSVIKISFFVRDQLSS